MIFLSDVWIWEYTEQYRVWNYIFLMTKIYMNVYFNNQHFAFRKSGIKHLVLIINLLENYSLLQQFNSEIMIG